MGLNLQVDEKYLKKKKSDKTSRTRFETDYIK